MSYFSLAHESADSTDTLASDVSAQPNTLQASDAGLQEAATESFEEMNQEGKGLDLLQDGEEKVQDIKEEVVSATESDGLSPQALKYLQVSLQNIVGKSFANKRLPSMEAAEKQDPHLVARIALEGVVDTIKQFWLAIKNQVGKFWNATKDWYIKTFDVANKIIARAKALNEKTNSMTSSPTEKSFSMGGASLLSVNYQIKDPATCIKGLGVLKGVLDTVLINVSKQNQSEKADKLLNAAQKLAHAVRSNVTQASNDLPRIYTDSQLGQSFMGSFLEDAPKYDNLAKIPPSQDAEMVKKLGIDGSNTSYAISEPMPGNKSFFSILPHMNTDVSPKSLEETNTLLDNIKIFRWLLADTAAKPKEMEDEQDVKTLMSGQVDQIAGLCEDMGTTILKYKKEFEARDKYIQRVVKGFDTIMKELESDVVDHDKGGTSDETAQRAQMGTNGIQDEDASAKKNGINAPETQRLENITDKAADANNQTADLKTKDPISQVDKTVRKLAQAILGIFKKNMTISGAVISHSTKVCNAFLSWGEKSASQYGSA